MKDTGLIRFAQDQDVEIRQRLLMAVDSLINRGTNEPNLHVVRIEFEDLVRIGIDGLSPDDLVIGTSVSRRNVVGNLVARAELGSVDHLDASRLRSTWLTWLLTRPVPLATIMAASGLQSARTLTELLDHLDSNDTDLTIVRTGSGS